MRFLANENFPADAVSALRAQRFDVIWIREAAPGIRDVDVLAWANREQRILLTFDKDFGELAFRAKLPATCGVVLFRIPKPSAWYVAHVILQVITSRSDWAGHFTVFEERRIRMRPLPAASSCGE